MKTTSIEIRKAETSDIAAVKQIESSCGLSCWTLNDYLSEIDRPDSIFLVAAAHPGKQIVGYITARLIMTEDAEHSETENILSGMLCDDIKEAASKKSRTEIEVYNIGVLQDLRRRNIATRMIEKAIENGGGKSVISVFLEVRKSNSAAIGFYLRNNFRVIGNRKNFYTDPVDDAVLMSLKIDFPKVL